MNEVQKNKGLGKLQPQSIDLEKSVLGAILLDKDAIFKVVESLKSENFYLDSHQIIYTAVIQLFDATLPIDLLTIVEELRKMGKLEKVGGAYYISKLTANVNSGANIEYHSRIILQKSIKRGIITISGNTLEKSYSDENDVFDIIDDLGQSLDNLTNTSLTSSVKRMSEVYDSSIDDLKYKCDNPGITGLPCGINSLDEVTSGWQKSDLIILAARPGMGKTAFAIKCVISAAVELNKPVAFFSLEMSTNQVINRIISSEAKINGHAIRKASLNNSDWNAIAELRNKIRSAPIFIDDTASLNIREFRSKCLKLKRKEKIELIIVDYLQLMVSPQHSKFREQEISNISRTLKAVAKEIDVPVIALAQLSRAVEQRGGEKKPMLSDLRESGSIEQDADQVMFLYRPEYYGFREIIDENDDVQSTEGIAQMIVAKNRHGSTPEVAFRFVKEYTKFEDLHPVSSQFPANATPDEPNFDEGEKEPF